MSAFTFAPAARTKIKGRLALTGPSGSGKTLGALLIAAGLVGPKGRIAVIDTEYQSASLYAGNPGIPAYDTCVLTPPYSIERYKAVIEQADQAGYDVIIIDSLSHAWAGSGGLLEVKDKIATSGKESGFTAWNKAGVKQNSLIDAIMVSRCHVIATLRSKQAYSQEEVDGKKTIRKLGMAPVQRDGMEYEFSIVLDIGTDHIATSSKDRSSLFDGQYFTINSKVGEDLARWLDSGAAAVPVISQAPAPEAAPVKAPALPSTPSGKPPEWQAAWSELQAALGDAIKGGLMTKDKTADVIAQALDRPATKADITIAECKAAAKEIRKETVARLHPDPREAAHPADAGHDPSPEEVGDGPHESDPPIGVS